MDLIKVTAEEKSKVRQQYKVDAAQIREAIDILKSWIEKQPHLPPADDDFLEKMLLRNKFGIERTKEKIENYFTLRGNGRELLLGFEKIVPSQQATTFIPMPRLTPNLERVNIMKIINPDPARYDIYDVIRINLAIGELALKNDYAVGDRFVFDLEHYGFSHILKANPLPLAKQVTIFSEGYSSRILSVELLNMPSYMDKIMGIFKLIMKPKLYQRLRVHNSLESLYDIIPRQCLPSDYGGTCSSVLELLEKWDNELPKHHEFFQENYENVAREHLRLSDHKSKYGIDGTFRKINID